MITKDLVRNHLSSRLYSTVSRETPPVWAQHLAASAMEFAIDLEYKRTISILKRIRIEVLNGKR